MEAMRAYHQLVLLWVKDPTKYQAYLQALRPIVSQYGGAADRIFQPSAIWAQGLELPDMINLVHYESRQAFAEFSQDPDFKRILPLRQGAIGMLAFEGYLELEQAVSEGLGQRCYQIELAYFKAGSPEAYRRYEAEGEGAMKDYGFEVEYVLKPEAGPAELGLPDLIKISGFRREEDRLRFEQDPRHGSIETELYPSAVEQAIWIQARLHPLMLA